VLRRFDETLYAAREREQPMQRRGQVGISAPEGLHLDKSRLLLQDPTSIEHLGQAVEREAAWCICTTRRSAGAPSCSCFSNTSK
jgi:hypothetical protein